MIKRDNFSLVLAEFFREPNPEIGGFHLRELSRKINLAPTSVKKYLDELEKNELITIKTHPLHNYPLYKANIKNDYFKYLKKLFLLQELKETGLIEFIEKQLSPKAMVLFGKAARGEDLSKEEIDLLIITPESKDKENLKRASEQLKDLETKLNRRLALIITSEFDELSPKLKNSIINGVVISGTLEASFTDKTSSENEHLEFIPKETQIAEQEVEQELEEETGGAEEDEEQEEETTQKEETKHPKKRGLFGLLKRKNYHKVRKEEIEEQERASIKQAIQTRQSKEAIIEKEPSSKESQADEEFYSSSLDVDEI